MSNRRVFRRLLVVRPRLLPLSCPLCSRHFIRQPPFQPPPCFDKTTTQGSGVSSLFPQPERTRRKRRRVATSSRPPLRREPLTPLFALSRTAYRDDDKMALHLPSLNTSEANFSTSPFTLSPRFFHPPQRRLSSPFTLPSSSKSDRAEATVFSSLFSLLFLASSTTSLDSPPSPPSTAVSPSLRLRCSPRSSATECERRLL